MSFRHAVRGLCAVALLVACGDEGGPAPASPLLTVAPQSVSLPAGGRTVVAASVTGAGSAVSFRWRVRDSALVVIDSLTLGGSVAHLRRVASGGTVVTVTAPALGLSADIPVIAFP